jgi:hypothetical protein
MTLRPYPKRGSHVTVLIFSFHVQPVQNDVAGQPSNFKPKFSTGRCRPRIPATYPFTLSLHITFQTFFTMCSDIMKQVETLGQNLLKLQDIDEQLAISLQKGLSSLADQVPLLITLDSVSQLVKKDTDLPIRRINYNIKKISEECKSRWIDLLKLDCESLIFCMISFNGLASLPDSDFNWLVQKIQDYVKNRNFPRYWILRDQVRKAVANTPRRDNTKQFIES